MALRIGQVLRGGKGKYELLEQLKGSSVFKARVLSNPSIQAEWAMVKSAATKDEKMCLKREYRNYGIHEIASSPYIRAMYDTVRSNGDQDDPSCLVFEWMDHDMRSVRADQFRGDPRLPRVVSQAVLSALKLFKTLNAVHTDVNVNNIYVSDIDRRSPIAKLGDLGNLITDGSTKQRLQSLPCRAPEVWQGLGCRHSSDVWSFGVTLARRLSTRPLFGPSDKIIEGHTEAWCIAKIIRLVGPLGDPIDCQTYKEEFELAEQLAVMENPHNGMKLINGGNWREELQRLPGPPVSPELLDFIESLLIVDHSKRPTASEALLHPYLQSSA
ncbi:kinase-like protein [Trematosphaeria pertusa]|uniref:Kinase-like protein n=1 Tax=Trematosphaeria pertusa TaxID=390896 RepID=A0A6A6ISG1_9PLEO|nr:kinase-like protein [Trematosphaeria pertusa]KAF2253495.1 kinase-like protein [Trematosphaeria pertusa]